MGDSNKATLTDKKKELYRKIFAKPDLNLLLQSVTTTDDSQDVWRLLTKAKDALEDGERMENLAWRLLSLRIGKSGGSGHSSDVNSPNCESRDNRTLSGPGEVKLEEAPAIDALRKKKIETECQNCHTKNTPLWRRDTAGNPLCNACGLFLKLHGFQRPLSMKTDVIRKRNRGSKKQQQQQPPAVGDEPSVGDISRSKSSGSLLPPMLPRQPSLHSQQQYLAPPPVVYRSTAASTSHQPAPQPSPYLSIQQHRQPQQQMQPVLAPSLKRYKRDSDEFETYYGSSPNAATSPLTPIEAGAGALNKQFLEYFNSLLHHHPNPPSQTYIPRASSIDDKASVQSYLDSTLNYSFNDTMLLSRMMQAEEPLGPVTESLVDTVYPSGRGDMESYLNF